MSILIIAHDLGVIADLAHRVAVMYRGQIVEEGSVREILKDPKHPYTRGLLDSVSDLRDGPGERIQTIPGVVPHPYAILPGCQFHPRCGDFIAGRCNNGVPATTELTPGRQVRCFLHERERVS